MSLVLFLISVVGGFFSGLLGVGGAVLLIPLMFAVPPLVGAGALTMHQISGLSMIQVLFSSVTGSLTHMHNELLHQKTVLSIGIPMGLAAFGGAWASRIMSEEMLLLIFGILVLIAFIMLLHDRENMGSEAGTYTFRLLPSIACGGCVGFLSGVVGTGGGFILIPMMIKFLKIPLKLAVGSSLGILFIGALFGSAAKMLTAQIDFFYLLPVLLGSIPSSFAGAMVSKKIAPSRLHRTLLSLLLLILLKTWYDLFKILSSHMTAP